MVLQEREAAGFSRGAAIKFAYKLIFKAFKANFSDRPWVLWIEILKTTLIVGYEVLTALTMKSSTFWDITTCSPVKVNGRFEGTYHLHLQQRHEAGNMQSRYGVQKSFTMFTRIHIENILLRPQKTVP
jgi:hypothetical protein